MRMSSVAAAEQSTWTAERLRSCVENCCGAGERVIVLANREPYRHERTREGGVTAVRSASGLVTALEPLLDACRGVWVAHGAGTADRDVVDWRDGLAVPQNKPAYRLRRVWLDAEEQRRYYYGFANEGLWPLCHQVDVEPVFRPEDFATYARVNDKFAAAVVEEANGAAPVVLVQDYHFALAPLAIRKRLSSSTIVTFWHIPWPTPLNFEMCPWGADLLDGLLASDVVGFHTAADCQRFFDSVEYSLDAAIDRRRGTISYAGRTVLVRDYPISIEWPSRYARQAPGVAKCRRSIRKRLNIGSDVQLVVGVDRLDYTKGICEKALAIEKLLETCPEFREKVTFVQIAEPSRDVLPAYRDLRCRLGATVNRINRRFGTHDYQPIVLREMHHDPSEVYEYLRAADVCYVGSLRDGMNLVAKEFAASRDDLSGVLVLSAFTGAAHQLGGALLVDPYATSDAARVLARALRMPADEQAARMRSMRTVVAEFNSYWWAGQMLADAAPIRAESRLLLSVVSAVRQKVPA